MLRRLLVVASTVVAIAGCGAGSPTAAPSASPSAVATVGPTAAPGTVAPGITPTPAAPATMTAACNAVALRKLPSSKGALVIRVVGGTPVRVAEIVNGDPYAAGNCGIAGDTWLKIDQVDGKDAKALYGAPVVYAAAGFFK